MAFSKKIAVAKQNLHKNLTSVLKQRRIKPKIEKFKFRLSNFLSNQSPIVSITQNHLIELSKIRIAV